MSEDPIQHITAEAIDADEQAAVTLTNADQFNWLILFEGYTQDAAYKKVFGANRHATAAGSRQAASNYKNNPEVVASREAITAKSSSAILQDAANILLILRRDYINPRLYAIGEETKKVEEMSIEELRQENKSLRVLTRDISPLPIKEFRHFGDLADRLNNVINSKDKQVVIKIAILNGDGRRSQEVKIDTDPSAWQYVAKEEKNRHIESFDDGYKKCALTMSKNKVRCPGGERLGQDPSQCMEESNLCGPEEP